MSIKPALGLLACLFLCVHCENICHAQPREHHRVHDDALGITFQEIGRLEKSDSTTYRMTLQTSDPPPPLPSIAEVSVTDRLFVDLPASYGGRLYLDTPSASRLFRLRVLVDSVNTGSRTFHREYWIVYAGMGTWEGVINCYTLEGRRYTIASLAQNLPLGKPGEEINGTPLVGENLKDKFLASLRDTTKTPVREFATLLASIIKDRPQ